jgi:hypothetical protein
MLLVLFILN